MREILFRGKRLDNGEWVEGSLLDYKPHYRWLCIAHLVEGEDGMMTLFQDDVDPNTVGQYTGLTDKNGTKIFEGDVLEFSDRLVEVFWHAFLGQWDCRFIKFTNKENSIDNMSTVNWSWKAKVIGNIHDNPELVR